MFDRYRNISLSLKNESLYCSQWIQLVLDEVSSGNQSMYRICILIGEMLEWVESLDALETLEVLDSTGTYWSVLEGAGACSSAWKAGCHE